MRTATIDTGTALHCYVHESLVGRLRDWVDTGRALQEAAQRAGYLPGYLVVEEDLPNDGVPEGLKALVRAAVQNPGTVAVAVPHLGHLGVDGDPYGWRDFVERVTERPVIVLFDDTRSGCLPAR
ncbi:hypothetical protein [Kribbella sp. NPDC055071]